jgi:hypothetical protein
MQTQRKTHFHFSFGSHATRADFEKLKSAAERFKPHIYAMEEPFLTKRQREEDASALNKGVQSARKRPDVRSQLIEAIRLSSDEDMREFHIEQFAFIIDSNMNLFLYPLEAHGANFFQPIKAQSDELRRLAVEALVGGDVARAAGLYLQSKKEFARGSFRRDSGIVQNMLTYADEALKLFPSLERFNPLKIFVRLGYLHEGAFESASAKYHSDSRFIISKEPGPGKYDCTVSDWATVALLSGQPYSQEWLVQGLISDIFQTQLALSPGFDKAKLVYHAGESSSLAAKIRIKDAAGVFAKNSIQLAKLDYAEWLSRVVSDLKKLVLPN